MFCLLMRCVLLPLRAFRPWVFNQPGRILTAYAIYTPSDGSSVPEAVLRIAKITKPSTTPIKIGFLWIAFPQTRFLITRSSGSERPSPVTLCPGSNPSRSAPGQSTGAPDLKAIIQRLGSSLRLCAVRLEYSFPWRIHSGLSRRGSSWSNPNNSRSRSRSKKPSSPFIRRALRSGSSWVTCSR